MKKVLALLMAAVMLLAFAACGDKKTSGNSSTPASAESSIISTDENTESTEDKTPSNEQDKTSSADGTQFAPAPSTSSKPSESAKPDVSSKPNSTAHTHSWGSWKLVDKAFIDKDGTEKRTCSTCSATQQRSRTKNAIHNSFYDGGLEVIFSNNYGTINCSTMFIYARHEFKEYFNKTVKSSVLFDELSKRFNLTEKDKTDILTMAESTSGAPPYCYDKANDTFKLLPQPDMGVLKLLGYVHNGGNKYTTYYTYAPKEFPDVVLIFTAELEYNRSNGKPNKYISVGKVDATPSNMINAPKDGESEYNM